MMGYASGRGYLLIDKCLQVQDPIRTEQSQRISSPTLNMVTRKPRWQQTLAPSTVYYTFSGHSRLFFTWGYNKLSDAVLTASWIISFIFIFLLYSSVFLTQLYVVIMVLCRPIQHVKYYLVNLSFPFDFICCILLLLHPCIYKFYYFALRYGRSYCACPM